MAQIVLTDAYVSINGVDLSDHVRQVVINYKAEVLDKTAMGATSRARIAGLKDWDARIDFQQDYAAAKTDATLFGIVGSSVAVIFRPVKGTVVGTTNPNFTGNAIVQDYQPLGGTVGELAMAPVTLLGDGTLTRATA